MPGVLVRFPDDQLNRIDAARREGESRPEAIRRLVDTAIALSRGEG